MVGGEECKFGHPRLHELAAVAYWQGMALEVRAGR